MSDAITDIITHCPDCGMQHLDVDEWCDRPHRTHLCLHCSATWRPSEEATRGIDAFCYDAATLERVAHWQLVPTAFVVTQDFHGKWDIGYSDRDWCGTYDHVSHAMEAMRFRHERRLAEYDRLMTSLSEGRIIPLGEPYTVSA